jgi:predicted metalloenzyme YecM
MSEERRHELEEIEAALERVTAEAKELMQRLTADLEEQTREHLAPRLDAAPPGEDDR